MDNNVYEMTHVLENKNDNNIYVNIDETTYVEKLIKTDDFMIFL